MPFEPLSRTGKDDFEEIFNGPGKLVADRFGAKRYSA
jgi:hypothetical protein